MAYRYALTRENYADFSGGVLHSAPGFPQFPVRLASEMFQRALALVPSSIAHVWDPCCGSGHLLTALAFLHRRDITSVLGTDVNPAALILARKNLDLLSEHGMDARSDELRTRAERLGKPAYLDAAAAAQRLARGLAERGGALPHGVARQTSSTPISCDALWTASARISSSPTSHTANKRRGTDPTGRQGSTAC